MEQDALLIGLGGDCAPVLLPLADFAFGIKEQIKGKPVGAGARGDPELLYDRGRPANDPAR